MKRATGILAAITLLLAANVSSAQVDKLIGKWRAKEMRSAKAKAKPVPPGMEIVVEFVKGGKFIGRIKAGKKQKVDEGTWKVKGKLLTTHINKRIESMSFKISGGNLILTKTKDKGSSLVLQRVN